MASSARPKKSRPGQSAKSKAQLNANKRAAAAEYNQVESKPFDIKTLVAQVSTANEKKKLSSTRVSKKEKEQAVLEAQVAQTEMLAAKEEADDAAKELLDTRTSAKEQLALINARKTRRKLARREHSAKNNAPTDDKVWAAEEAVRIFGVMLSVVEGADEDRKDPKIVTPYYHKAKLALSQLPSGSNSRLSLFNKMVLLTKRYKALFEASEDNLQEVEKTGPRHERVGRTNKIKPWKSLQRALSLIGHKGKGQSTTHPDKAKGTPSIISGVVSGVGSFIVKSTSQIGGGLRDIGKAIKENGLDTLKWVGSRLHDLGSKVMGLFRSAKNFLGGGDATDLLAMAAIAMGILPSLVAGMNEELKKQFGDNYISDFISKHWEATKTTVLDWISKLIDTAVQAVKDLPKQISEKGKAAAGGAAHLLGKAWDGLTGKDNPEGEKTGKDRLAIKSKGGIPPLRQFVNLLDEYDRSTNTPEQKEAIKIKLQQLVAANPELAKEQRVINNLNQRGISLSANVTKGAVTSTSNVSVPGGATANATSPPSSANTSVGLAGSSGGDTNVTVAQPPQSVGDTPVTATKPPPPSPTSDAGASSDPGASGGAKTSGLSNAAVPNQAVPDTLAFMNLAGMGMT